MRSLWMLLLLVCSLVSNAALVEEERRQIFSIGAGVRVCLIAPSSGSSGKPVHLVIYALPNGSTLEHALGKVLPPGSKSPYGDQQIAAQTRFLRAKAEPGLVVACVEASGQSWPAWRTRGGDGRIVGIVNTLATRVGASRVSLTGHSGGGSFLFGYINAVAEIPPQIDRIAFMDATYAYETERHAAKLAYWIKGSNARRLVVLAYRDDRALWNGKPFIRAGSGTGFRSRLMHTDLDQWFSFWSWRSRDIVTAKAAGGRIQIAIHQNPRGERLHMAVVGRNGFIHANALGTGRANRGYRWMDAPAYEKWIGD